MQILSFGVTFLRQNQPRQGFHSERLNFGRFWFEMESSEINLPSGHIIDRRVEFPVSVIFKISTTHWPPSSLFCPTATNTPTPDMLIYRQVFS